MVFSLLRVIIGGILLASGFSKAIGPHQNFLYVIQAYQMLPAWGETAASVVMPWIELIVGLFMVLGLWVPLALRGALLLYAAFVVVIGQALLRGLPLENCGCFGSWIHVLPQQVIVLDSLCVLTIFVLLRNIKKTQRFSLDAKLK